jgi:hypothetical protein
MDIMSLPEVTEIQRWALRPGDRLIVRVEQEINPQQVDEIRRRVRVVLGLPDEVPILVAGKGISVSVAEVQD